MDDVLLLLLCQYLDGAVVAEILYPVELGSGYLGSLTPSFSKSPHSHGDFEMDGIKPGVGIRVEGCSC